MRWACVALAACGAGASATAPAPYVRVRSEALDRPRAALAVVPIVVQGNVDAAATAVARDVTEGLRRMTRRGFRPVSAMPDCDATAGDCRESWMTAQDVDYIVWGRLDPPYRLRLGLASKTQQIGDFVAELDPPAASSELLERIYRDLVANAIPQPAALEIQGLDDGTVEVDGTARSGRRFDDLALGRHHVVIRTRAGGARDVDVDLAPATRTVIVVTSPSR